MRQVPEGSVGLVVMRCTIVFHTMIDGQSGIVLLLLFKTFAACSTELDKALWSICGVTMGHSADGCTLSLKVSNLRRLRPQRLLDLLVHQR